MIKRKIGDVELNAIGLGCMGMSWAYGPADRDESLAVLNRSLELGCTHWDTADLYGAGENETLLAEALKTHRDQVFLASKFGNVYDKALTSHQDQVAAGEPWIVDGTPAYIRRCIDLSLQRLAVEHIDLYYQHRVDPKVPVEETWGELKSLVQEGKVRYLGISEASAATIRRAHKVHPVSALQSEYSIWTRDPEGDVLDTLDELGIALVAYSPLGRGFLTGAIKSPADLDVSDWRLSGPRWQEDTFAKNMEIVDRISEVATAKGATNAQIALAWVLAQGDRIHVIPGTRSAVRLQENLSSAEVTLSRDDLGSLDGLEAVGARYAPTAAKYLNG